MKDPINLEEEEKSIWEFSKYALQRNDEAIRFSETKAALLLTLIGVLLSGVISNLEIFPDLISSDSLIVRHIAYLSLILIGIGLILALFFICKIIFPRLNVIKGKSFLYFNDNELMSDEEINLGICGLTAKDRIDNIISQVNATSKIAHVKFKYFQKAIISSTLLLAGFLILIILFIFCL